MDIGTAEWIRCPVCGGKTRDKMRIDTELRNFLLFFETIAAGNKASTNPKITQKTVDQRIEVLIASRRRANFFAP